MNPTPRGLAKITVRPINPLRIQGTQLSHAGSVPCFFMNSTEHTRTINGLAQDPVHTGINDRATVPVGCVDEASGAMAIPTIGARTIKELFSSFDHPVIAISEADQCCARMKNQTRPLHTVTGGSAIGTERIRRAIRVVLGEHIPVSVEVFRNAPVQLLGSVGNETTNAASTVQPQAIPRRIEGGKVGLDSVHIGVHAAVVLADGVVAVPSLADASKLRFPPVLVLVSQRAIEQLSSSGTSQNSSGTRRQNDKGMRVGLLEAAICGFNDLPMWAVFAFNNFSDEA